MSEPEVPAPEPAEASVYSKDYWDNVFEQVGRRPLVKVALAVMALLYASAIYAPLVASDRPYVLEAVDYKEYSRSLKILYGATSSLQRLLRQGQEGFEEGLKDTAKIRDYEEALDIERNGITTRLDLMRTYLTEDKHARLDAFGELIEEACERAGAGDLEAATALGDEARDTARTLRDEYVAVDPEDPESEGFELAGQTSYPLFEETVWYEAVFMWMWVWVLTWPLWNKLVNKVLLGGDRTRIRRARRRKLALVVGSSLLIGVLWELGVGGRMAHESANYKELLSSGELVATRVVFPPLAMGMAETNTAEQYRPPTWHASSEISEEGYYVRGPRAVGPDPESGYMPPPREVTVKSGERPLNDSWRHFLGTDQAGRDLFVRILYGGRISLLVGILSTTLLCLIGVVVGAVAGYFGGWVDIIISRIIEIFQAFPAFFLILTAVTLIPDRVIHPIFAIIFFIAIVRWTGVARLVRAEFLRLKEQEFVIAAQALGFSNRRVIFRHVLPNAMGPVLVAAAFSVAAGILTESAISFLGLGIKVPIPSWGSLLNEAKGSGEYWWLQIFPGLLIFVTVFCYNIVGEGVRDALDPRRKV